MQVLRDRLHAPLPVFREHKLKFGFDPHGGVFIVSPDGDMRMGLPEWINGGVPVMSHAEMLHHFGGMPVYGQMDVMLLLTHFAEWKVRGWCRKVGRGEDAEDTFS